MHFWQLQLLISRQTRLAQCNSTDMTLEINILNGDHITWKLNLIYSNNILQSSAKYALWLCFREWDSLPCSIAYYTCIFSNYRSWFWLKKKKGNMTPIFPQLFKAKVSSIVLIIEKNILLILPYQISPHLSSLLSFIQDKILAEVSRSNFWRDTE